MPKIIKSVFIFSAALLVSWQASAEVSFNSARVVAEDVLATGEFYKAAFGMYEVQRLNLQGGNVELMLNFGATEQAAKDNPDAQVVIMHRDAGAAVDPVAHLIFNVTDMDSTVAAIKAAGGTITREPFEFGKTGIWICMTTDPAGNQVELLKQP
ncbi:MAG: VOC family protein [Pseudomonadota bacterium]